MSPLCLFGLLAFASLAAYAADSPVTHVIGHYSDEQLSEVRTLILPRTFLYDASNRLAGANWAGLMDVNGTTIDLKAIPSHKWLLVEYGASWCAPSVVQDKQLAKIFASEKHAADYGQ